MEEKTQAKNAPQAQAQAQAQAQGDLFNQPTQQPQPQPTEQSAPKPRPTKPDDIAIERINQLVEDGFQLPEGYNHVNAIKMAYIQIQNTLDKQSGYKPLSELCTPASIQTALFQMAKDGLDATKGQCYFSKRGNALAYGTEYHATTLQVQRIFPNYTPCPKVVYEGDIVEYGVDPKTGRRILIKHEQKMENLDNGFVGAYLYIPCKDGGQDLYVMTKKMIMTAWLQSKQGQAVHNKFTDKMVCKTIINSALDGIVRSDSGNSVFIANEPMEEERVVEVVEVDNVEAEEVK